MNTVGHTSVPRQFKEWNLPTRCCIRRSPGLAAAESEHAAEWGWSGQCSCMPFSGPPYGCFTLRYSLIPHCEICYLSCDCLDSIKALTSLHLSSFPLLLQLCCWWGWWFRMLKDGVFSSTFADLKWTDQAKYRVLISYRILILPLWPQYFVSILFYYL